jgi:hypothetical protein
MKKHAEVGAEMAKLTLGARGLNFSNKEIAHNSALIAEHMVDLDGTMPEAELRVYIVRHQDIIDDLVDLKRADMTGSSFPNYPSVSADRLEKFFAKIKTDGTPLSIKDLSINGEDLINTGIQASERGVVMDRLWDLAIANPDMRNRESQLDFLKRCL